MRGETGADRHHLAMRGRILHAFPHVEPARQNLTPARDDGAKGRIGLRCERERFTHEACIFRPLGTHQSIAASVRIMPIILA
jgi:hypothetical protein